MAVKGRRHDLPFWHTPVSDPFSTTLLKNRSCSYINRLAEEGIHFLQIRAQTTILKECVNQEWKIDNPQHCHETPFLEDIELITEDGNEHTEEHTCCEGHQHIPKFPCLFAMIQLSEESFFDTLDRTMP